MNLIKRTIALIIICSAMLGVTAFAVTDAALPYINIQATSSSTVLSSASNGFNISQSSGYSLYDATTIGTDDATSVSVSMVVQRRVNGVWESVPYTYKAASTSSSRIIAIEGERFLEKGYWYRLQSVHTAYSGSTPYTTVLNSAMQWYN